MLDSNTKNRIDSLRNILVGKVPDPKSQIEQISTALFYKFMNDIDQDAIEMGGIPSFFVDEYERFSWSKLLNSSLSGHQRVNLYTECIESMYKNPKAPKFFRDIFKNTFLPFKDPVTLNMFLKEIDNFNYYHSEQLGDAYEYLLSFMGSQGEAGQFRTPRHIIDFIVQLIDPKKNESILDPACGTSGFLISSYKHILNENTKDKIGDCLTANDRSFLADSLCGYDISPDMARISMINMYLHDFLNPKIYEYDCLSNSSRWKDYFDVILANPPFMTPKGGIKPHDLYTIDSPKSEVLFVDFIINHIKPNGRFAVIVPEGINFVETSAYKKIRSNLINLGLICDISLPHGVFKPYASVKTHILIFDKNFASINTKILFIEIENDGFTQSDTRLPVDGEELTNAVEIFKLFKENSFSTRTDNPISYLVDKDEILRSRSTHLIGRWFDLSNRITYPNDCQRSKIIDLCRIEKGLSPNMATIPGEFQMVVPAPNFKTSEKYDFIGKATCIPLVSSSGHGKADIKRLHFVRGKFALANTMCALFSKDEKVLVPEYLYVYLTFKTNQILVPLMKGATNVTMDIRQLQNLFIPLPSRDIQIKISHKFLGQRLYKDMKDKIDMFNENDLNSSLKKLAEDIDEKLKQIDQLTSDMSEIDQIL